MPSSKGDVDSGWAWVILAGNFLSMICHACMMYGVGVIHVELLHQFRESDTYTSLAGSLFSSLTLFIGPIGTTLMNQYGCRVTMCIGALLIVAGFVATFLTKTLTTVILTYGLIAGTGNALTATPPYVCLGHYFEQRYNLAVGVTAAGAGVGMLISGPILQTLFDYYAFHGAFLFLAGIGAQQFVFGFLMRPPLKTPDRTIKLPKMQACQKENCQKIFDYSVLKNKSFLLMTCQYLLWTISFSMLILHLPNFAVLEGASEGDGALLLFISGCAGTFGRFLGGLSSGPYGIDPLLMNLGMTGILGLSSITVPLYSSTYLGKSIFASLFGFYNGSLMTLSLPVLIYLLGVSRVSTAFGLLYLIGGFGYIMGPILAGLILDEGGTYELNFIICGVLYFSSTLLTCVCSTYLDTTAVHAGDKSISALQASGLIYGSSRVSVKADDNNPFLKPVDTPLLVLSQE